MESSVLRRLDSLSRHLLPPRYANSVLHPVLLRGEQVKHEEAEAVIIGGMVLDIHATPSIPINPRTTTPGKVHYVLGGVARNVAECMSKLGTKPYMISIVGLDVAGNLLLEHWKSAGLTTEVAAESGVPLWFEPVSVAKSKRIASVVKYITFASPNEDELIAMANALSCEEVFQPIQNDYSKIKSSTESLFLVLKPAIWVLLEKGIKIVVVTLGSNGVFLCSKGGPGCMKIGVKKAKPYGFGGQLYKTMTSSCPSNRFFSAKEFDGTHLFAVHFPALPASVVRLTGAGDCLVGGALASMCAGLDVLQSVAVGIAAAKAAVESEANVPAEYSLAAIADDARSVYSAAKVMFHQSML